MENQSGDSRPEEKNTGLRAFAVKRIVIAAILIIAVVWVFGLSLGKPDRSDRRTGRSGMEQTQASEDIATVHSQQPEGGQSAARLTTPKTESEADESEATASPESGHAAAPAEKTAGQPAASGEQPNEATAEHATPASDSEAVKAETQKAAAQHAQPAETTTPAAEPQAEHVQRPRGVAFVEAVIKPIDYELNQRFWGWRPNDIINITDNINNFQLGVLEVTRRSVVSLSERISRTGSTDSLNPHLEDAANWLMVTATRYWFPSPESKYKECIKELKIYRQALMEGRGSFYIRADNLIPLLASYEDLLGSCDENLVKVKEEDGSRVGYFQADDYFFYAKGVASTMATILEAIHHDFLPTLENRHGTELLHHALESCKRAASLSPLLITNADLDGIFANHRANMAAPISHARFYIGQLIKTLST